ncbi:PIH1 domain-containing protein 1 [Lamellibrachia satsuma]|nr:PIH1 domain-containing protein 1 [Lamellibrachia satsuma]
MEGKLLESEEDALFKQFLLQSGGKSENPNVPQKHFQPVVPKPGYCLKTKTDKDEKVFINICKNETVPAPRDITDEELLKLLEAEDASGFRIPMSLGEAHAEIDKSGNGCTAYDVVISPNFYDKTEQSQVLLGFFLTVVLEGIEYKYNLTLDRNWRILKNRKFVGSLPEQNIRTQSKPWIMEMGDGGTQPIKPSLISEMEDTQSERPRAPEPVYSIIREPPEGHPEFLVAEIQLPKVKMAATVTLDIGEDRILLETRSNVYRLDIFLPFNLVQEECGAQFNRKTKILTLTLPVQSIS